MEPTYSTGDAVLLRTADSYKIGDIVAYQVPKGQPAAGLVVVHRIVGRAADDTLLLQGDNNAFVDSWVINDEHILGREALHVPGLAGFLGSSWTLALILAAILARLVYLICSEPPERIYRTTDPEVAQTLIERLR